MALPMTMKSLAALCLLLAGAPVLAATTESSTPLGQRCEVQTSGGDHRDIQCPLGVADAPRHFRFRSNYSGGHDDTSARLATVALDDAPLACEDGSKTELFGEDGDVHLECRFTVPARAGAAPRLHVVLVWSHCQFTSFELVAD